MKVHFNALSSEYVYPLCKKEVLRYVSLVFEQGLRKIGEIEFGCNTKTTQEGRIVQHGDRYNIRINFCLKNLSSTILSNSSVYMNQIKVFASCVDMDSGLITWKLHEAKRYALFLLFHEIGHIVYSESHSSVKMSGSGTRMEEQWCDRYAMQMLDVVGCKIVGKMEDE